MGFKASDYNRIDRRIDARVPPEEIARRLQCDMSFVNFCLKRRQLIDDDGELTEKGEELYRNPHEIRPTQASPSASFDEAPDDEAEAEDEIDEDEDDEPGAASTGE